VPATSRFPSPGWWVKDEHHTDDRQGDAAPIHASMMQARAFGQDRPASHQHEQADWQVDQENPAPAEAEEVECDQAAAEHRADDDGQPGHGPGKAEGGGALVLGEARVNDGQHLRHHQRGAGTLKQPPGDQRGAVRCQATQRRGKREQPDPGEKDLAVAEKIAETATREKPECEDQQIAGNHPLQRCDAGTCRPLDRGQRNVDDGDVEQVHEIGEKQDEQRLPALGIGRGFGGRVLGVNRGCHLAGNSSMGSNVAGNRETLELPRVSRDHQPYLIF
jgi:hypothetical protein